VIYTVRSCWASAIKCGNDRPYARRVSIDGAIARGCLKKGKQLDSFFLLAAKVALEIEDRPDFLPVQQDWRPAISLLNQFFLDVLPALAGAGSG